VNRHLLDRPVAVRPALLASGAAAVAFLLLMLAVVRHSGPLVRIDAVISAAAYRTAVVHPLWRSIMAGITVTGSTIVITPLAAVGCLVLIWRGAWRHACFVAVTLAVTLMLRLFIVDAVDRPRPTDQLAPATGWAFPSGHTAASAAVALISALLGWRWLTSRRKRFLLTGVAGVWAAAVAISRVALVVHWPSDVLGSWLLVLAVVPASAVLWQAAFDRHQRPVKPVSGGRPIRRLPRDGSRRRARSRSPSARRDDRSFSGGNRCRPRRCWDRR
jgi:undecaprenyl-diphosphatase